MNSPTSPLARTTIAFALFACLALPRTVTLSSPQATGSSSTQRFRGHVAPSRQVELGAAVEEILRSIEVREGDKVSKGQLLAQLDDRLQTVIVEAARLTAVSEAEEKMAAHDLAEAREHLERSSRAFDRGAATDMELQRANINVGKAEAAHTRAVENRSLAQVKLELEKRRLERFRLVAPFDGTVLRIMAEAGSSLTAQDTVLVLVELKTLEARMNLPAALYGQIDKERAYVLSAGAPVNAELTGRLRNADPVIDTASETFRCVFTIDNADLKLPAGFSVSLHWPPRDPPAPSAAAELITAHPDP